jgi:hypothetical protein
MVVMPVAKKANIGSLEMFEPTEKLILGSVFFGLVVLIGGAIWLDSGHREQVNQESIRCAEAGGVYLERTYTVGKNQTGHLYTCVSRDVIIKDF